MGRRLAEVDLTLSLSPQGGGRPAHRRAEAAAAAPRLGGQIGSGIGPPLCVVFEGWDAAGKGGAIKRLVDQLDPRHVRVAQFAAPTYDEKRHHFLWRFWPRAAGLGRHGRVRPVLVRAGAGRAGRGVRHRRAVEAGVREIVEFERTLVAEGMIIVKFWLHMSDEEQLRRFERRQEDPLQAVEADRRGLAQPRASARRTSTPSRTCSTRTDHPAAPWHVIEGDNKRWARVGGGGDGRRGRGGRDSGPRVPRCPRRPPRWSRSCTSEAGNRDRRRNRSPWCRERAVGAGRRVGRGHDGAPAGRGRRPALRRRAARRGRTGQPGRPALPAPARPAVGRGVRGRGGVLRCSYHGWEFGPTGACVAIPSNGPGTGGIAAGVAAGGARGRRGGVTAVCGSAPMTCRTAGHRPSCPMWTPAWPAAGTRWPCCQRRLTVPRHPPG